MSALPADIARYTSDGVVVTAPASAGDTAAIKALHRDARDPGDSEIEMFFDDPEDAQALLEERFAIQSRYGQPHELVEVEDSLGLGTRVPLVPVVPSFRVVDADRLMDASARTRAYGRDMGTDRYSVEVLG